MSLTLELELAWPYRHLRPFEGPCFVDFLAFLELFSG
jgi:hypothetical protein